MGQSVWISNLGERYKKHYFGSDYLLAGVDIYFRN